MIILSIILIFSVLIFEVIYTAKIKLEIYNLEIKIDNDIKTNMNMKIKMQTDKKNIIKSGEIFLKIYVLRRIKLIQIDLNKIHINRERIKKRLEKIKNINIFKRIKKEIRINLLELIKKLELCIEKMDLNIELGTEDASFTAMIVGFLSTIIAILLKDKISNVNLQKYEINPIYQNRNMLKIQLDGIFGFEFVNIIYIIKILGKRRVKENGRTSHRRSYAYSNEQYKGYDRCKYYNRRTNPSS